MLNSESMDRAAPAARSVPRRRFRLTRWALRLIWLVVQVGIALYGLAMIAYLVSQAIAGDDVSMVGFFGNFYPWLAWGGFILALIALFSRRRKLLIALQLPGIILFVILYGELFWPQQVAVTQGTPLTVATFNVHVQSDPHALATALTTLDVDMLGIEELNTTQLAALEEALDGRYPYRAIYAKEPYVSGQPAPKSGIGLLSRYPILDEEIIITNTKMRQLRAIVNVEGTPVTVYVVHLDNPKFMPPTAYDTSPRTTGMNALLPRFSAETNPVIILCDCNMTDLSDDYRALAGLFNDAFRQVGWGMGFTFPASAGLIPPAIRIDYVWHSDELVALDATVSDGHGPSDHQPVVAELILRDSAPSERAAR